jgi:hypothetical protein
VISPVLANVYLHRLDRQWTRRRTGVLVRYADDLVLCHSEREAEAALVSLRSILAELGLRLKAAKTRIVHLREGGEGLDFLGPITVACAGSAATGTCGSSPAGPHERQCKAPAIGSVRSRTLSGSATRSK